MTPHSIFPKQGASIDENENTIKAKIENLYFCGARKITMKKIFFAKLSMILISIAGMSFAQTDTVDALKKNPSYSGSPAQTVPIPACMKLAWEPTEQEIDACIKNPRASYVPEGPGGLSAIRMFAPGDGARQTLAQCQMPIPGAIDQKPQAARLCAQMYIPDDGSSYSPNAGGKGAGGRTLFGLGVNSGKRVEGMFAGNGGTPPHLQYSANIRMNRQNDGRMQLYSYHLNRSDAGRKAFEDSREGAYLSFGPDGKPRRTVPYFHFGDAKTLSPEWPMNQWFTVCMDVTLNTYDANGKALANGLSRLSMYGNASNLLGSTQFSDAIYSRDPSGFISSIQFDEKWNSEKRNSGKDSNSYYRKYQILLEDKENSQCR
jgi:hypothetical protein